jgi:hypothetical protein
MKKPDARVGHGDGQRGRGMTVREPEPGTSNPPGSDGLLRENSGEYGRARGPCQPILCRLRQGLWSSIVVALTPFVIGLWIVKEPLEGHRRPLFRQSRAFR